MIKTNFLFLSNQHWIGRRKVQGGSHGGFSCWFGWSHCNRMGVGSSPKTHSHDISLCSRNPMPTFPLQPFQKGNSHTGPTLFHCPKIPIPWTRSETNPHPPTSPSPTNGEKKKQENFGFPFKWNNSKLRYMQAFNNGCVLI